MFKTFLCLLAFNILIAGFIHGARMQMNVKPEQSGTLENKVRVLTWILQVANPPGTLILHVERKLEISFLDTTLWRETLRPIYYLLIVWFESWLYVAGIRWVIRTRQSKP